ncbi:MAG TPA: hypothetical protein DCM28_22425 [Phycisphaerales bacterium]|nr:hypothetical protein [Phycisphaerales bacterium]HCD31968.1 hypothetical protein [Phycisphaerales bacterium]|tara:strand:- start:535 stop:993 length:459 start_codon:yes stop_codon:yes gene_type:complete
MKQHRGITLVEMIYVLSLCMFLTLLTSMLFMTSTRLIQAQYTSKPKLQQLDGMIATLRQDVWASQHVSVIANHTLELSLPKQKVVWSVNDDITQIVRTENDTQRYFPVDIAMLNWTIVAGGVDVEVHTSSQFEPVSMRLLSAQLLKEAQHDQ